MSNNALKQFFPSPSESAPKPTKTEHGEGSGQGYTLTVGPKQDLNKTLRELLVVQAGMSILSLDNKPYLTEIYLGAVGLRLNATGLPWTRLLSMMADQGIYIDNYPYIMLPHEQRDGQGKSKGVGNLRQREQMCLYYALVESIHHPCQFKIYGNGTLADRKGV